MTSERERLLEAALAASLDAGRAILAAYEAGTVARTKRDGTPVTDADERAEAIIVEALAGAAPDIPMVGEESTAAGRAPTELGRRYWLVDPLDGTREFIARNNEFCVSIGLIEDGRPVLGVLHGPALGLTFAAAQPGQVFRLMPDGARLPVRARRAPSEGLTVMVSRSHRDQARIERYLTGTSVKAARPMGSALKFGLVASGEADLYPRLGPTSEWDTAGGEAILVAAGGSLALLDGGPLLYGKPKFLNPPFVARGLA